MASPTQVSEIVTRFAESVDARQSRLRLVFFAVLVPSVVVATAALMFLSQQVRGKLERAANLTIEISQLTKQRNDLLTEQRLLQAQSAALRRDLSEAAPYAPAEVSRQFQSPVTPQGTERAIGPSGLVAEFSSIDRLTASNQLISLYPKDKSGVVDALTSAVLPDSADSSYRVNLYVAFTLARIPGGWEATESQYARIRSLVRSANMKDPTFSRWVKEAIEKGRLVL